MCCEKDPSIDFIDNSTNFLVLVLEYTSTRFNKITPIDGDNLINDPGQRIELAVDGANGDPKWKDYIRNFDVASISRCQVSVLLCFVFG